jgi:hypothetical protein
MEKNEKKYQVFSEVLPEKQSVNNITTKWKDIYEKEKKSSKKYVVSQTSNELYDLMKSNDGKYLGSYIGEDNDNRGMTFDYMDKVVQITIKTYDYEEVVG